MKSQTSVHDSWDGLKTSEVGFPRRLPSNIILRRSTEIEKSEKGINFVRGERTVVINASGEALAFLNTLSLNQAVILQKAPREVHAVLETLLSEGIVGDAASYEEGKDASGFSMIGCLADLTEAFFDTKPDALKLISDLAAGRAPKELVHGWLLESFFYTCSARYHIAPVVLTVVAVDEKMYWKEFLDDESEHWRIYLKLFKELNWDHQKARALEPLPGTKAFIEGLKDLAIKGQVIYSSVLSFIEKAPDVPSMDLDPIFASLYKYYGFQQHSVRPLWAHAVHNGSAAHDLVGTRVLASVPILTEKEQRDILSANVSILNLVRSWHLNILEYYSESAQAKKRFSHIYK